MHTDLAPHLHSTECNNYISQLKACHEENTFGRFLGYCNELDNLVVKCLKQERIKRSAANRARALEKQKLIKEKMQEPKNTY